MLWRLRSVVETELEGEIELSSATARCRMGDSPVLWRNAEGGLKHDHLMIARSRCWASRRWSLMSNAGPFGMVCPRLAVTGLDRPGERMLSVQLVDLTAERLAQVDLEHERDFTAAVLDTANTLIVVLDEHGQDRALQPGGREGQRLRGRGRARCAGSGTSSGPGSATCSTPGSVPATPGLRRSRHVVEDEWAVPSGERRTVRLVVRLPRPGRRRLATW